MDIEIFSMPTRGNPYLSDLAIKSLEDACEEEEAPARLDGVFKHLSGLVYKEFGALHRIPAFKIPKDWTRYMVQDFHQREDCALVWYAVDPKGQLYFYDELKSDGTIFEISEVIKQKEKAEYGRHVPTRWIDSIAATPDRASPNKRSALQEFRWCGTKLEWSLNFRSSIKNRELGHKSVHEYLRIKNGVPGCYFFEENGNLKGVPNVIGSMLHYQHDPKDDIWLHFADCYDMNTEILTNSGWKYFKDIIPLDMVATISKRGFIEFQKPTDYICHKHNGKMVEINSKSVDLRVTPGHTMLVKNKKGVNIKKFASEIKKCDRIPIGSSGIDSGIDTFQLNRSKIDGGDWAEFMGWYISEGSVTGSRGGKIQVPGRGYSVYISQSITANPGKVKRIELLLKRLPFNFHYNGKSFVISNKELWAYLSPLGNSEQKYIPREILSMSKKCLERLWESLVLGDGTCSNGKVTYTTVSKCLTNDVSELLARMGFASSVSVRLNNGGIIRGCKVNGKFVQFTVVQKFKK